MPLNHEFDIRVLDAETGEYLTKHKEFKSTYASTPQRALEALDTIISNAPTAGTGTVKDVNAED